MVVPDVIRCKMHIFFVSTSQKPGCVLHLMPRKSTAAVYMATRLFLSLFLSCLGVHKIRVLLTIDNIFNVWNTIRIKASVD